MSKVATIVGQAGMTSDDGRALTYGWRIFTNENGGRGFYEEPHYEDGTEADARQWCEDHGYTVESVRWS